MVKKQRNHYFGDLHGDASDFHAVENEKFHLISKRTVMVLRLALSHPPTALRARARARRRSLLHHSTITAVSRPDAISTRDATECHVMLNLSDETA
jgi:hypothetical protein